VVVAHSWSSGRNESLREPALPVIDDLLGSESDEPTCALTKQVRIPTEVVEGARTSKPKERNNKTASSEAGVAPQSGHVSNS